MLIELVLAASGSGILSGVCDPPKPNPDCYTYVGKGLEAALKAPASADAMALASVTPLKPVRASWKVPTSIGPLEADFLGLSMQAQRPAMNMAIVAALTKQPSVMASGKWLGPDKAFDATAYSWQGLRLADRAYAKGEYAKAVVDDVIRGPVLSPQALAQAKGTELGFPAWILLGALGVQNNAEPFNNYRYTLTMLRYLEEAMHLPVERLKGQFKVPRPYAKNVWGDSDFVPQLEMPPTLAYPAGHAAQAAAAAHLLAALGGGAASDLMGHARGVAERRKLGGLHTALDNEAGLRLGEMAARELLEQASSNDGPLRGLFRKVAQELASEGGKR